MIDGRRHQSLVEKVRVTISLYSTLSKTEDRKEERLKPFFDCSAFIVQRKDSRQDFFWCLNISALDRI